MTHDLMTPVLLRCGIHRRLPAGYADALARVYDAEGARLNDGGKVVRGRSAIAADVREFLANVGPVRVELKTSQVWLVDDTGVWSYAFHPKGQAEQHIGGRYVTLWKRQPEGGWRIWTDMGVPGT
jgi:ketosteroid isomerase-like protein